MQTRRLLAAGAAVRSMSARYQAHSQAQSTIHQPGSKLDEIMIVGAFLSQPSISPPFFPLIHFNSYHPPTQFDPQRSAKPSTMGGFQPSPPPKYTPQVLRLPPPALPYPTTIAPPPHELDSFQHTISTHSPNWNICPSIHPPIPTGSPKLPSLPTPKNGSRSPVKIGIVVAAMLGVRKGWISRHKNRPLAGRSERWVL